MKFTQTNKNPFFTGLKERVNAHFEQKNQSTYGNRRIVLKGAIILSVYLLAYLNLYLPGNTSLTFFLSYFVLGIMGVMIVFNIVHDASHHALFNNKKLNNYARYLGDLVGINTYIWDIRHNIQHHTFTNVLGGDLIIEAIPLLRLSPEQQHKRFHRFQRYYAPVLYMFYSLYWTFVIDFRLFFKKEICNLKNIQHPLKEWLILISFKLLHITYLIVLPTLFTSLSLSQILLYFFLMHLGAGLLLSIVAVLGHFVEGPSFPHVGEDELIENSWSEHELEATIDFAPGSKIVHWITGGLNTHVAHHLFPRMCHVHYFEVTPIIASYCEEFGYPYKKESFMSALKSHWRYLGRMGMG